MMTGLDEMILEADRMRDDGPAHWQEKHLPMKYRDRIYWLTLEVPAEMAAVLAHLPPQREQEEQRLHQIKIRLSDEELEAFDLLVLASGLTQGEYIRGMVLHGCVEVTQTSLVDARALEQLTELSAELGRVAGMIRRTVIVNKDFAILSDTDKARLELQIRELRRLQSSIQHLAEEIYGNL